jgi:hypothetical protein
MGTAGALLAANEASAGAEQSAAESAPHFETEKTSQSGGETRTCGTRVQGQAPPSKAAGTVGDVRRAAVGTAASAVLAQVESTTRSLKRPPKHPKELHNHSDGSSLRKAVPMGTIKLQSTGQTKAPR